MNSDNPLLDLRQGLPFDLIKAEHVRPAAQALIARARDALQAIKTTTVLDYDSVLGRLDDAAEPLELAMTVVGHLESVKSAPDLREAYNQVKPEVSAFYAGIPLDPELWRVLKAYAATPDAKAQTGAKKRYLEKTIADFKRHGADLDDAGKARLEAITRELAELTAKFGQNVLDSTAGFELYVGDEARLSGLPDSAKEAAKESAAQKGKGGFRFTLQAPSVIPVLTYLDDAGVREQIWRAYNQRAAQAPFENQALTLRILELRKEEARLLGFANFADFVLEDRMAKNGAAAVAFIDDLTRRTRPAFEKENQELLAFRRELEGPTAPALRPWDVGYYAEKLRQARYEFDEEELRPYFALDAVMGGLFSTAERLYGIKIRSNDRMSTWHKDVRCYDVLEENGERLGSFYADVFPREEKRGGAWMNGLVSGVLRAGRVAPHLGLICANVTPPVGDKPALLTHDEVSTLFHEFGHLLHHLLSRVEVRSLAGTNVAWDFVELPSQIMENWCWERAALDLFAHHYQTGAPIPEPLFQKMTAARTFRAANQMMRQLGFANLDLWLHTQYEPGRDGDLITAAKAKMQPYAPATFPEGYAFLMSFTHLFSSAVGYAAGYYSYKWAEVLDADAFTRFQERGVFDLSTGRAFRESVLASGDGADPMVLFERFMGRKPALEPLLVRSGLLNR